MTTVIEELEIDWAPFEELKDDRPCNEIGCSATATWVERLTCCGAGWPKCDMHKKVLDEMLHRMEKCALVRWHCAECGASGVAVPGIRVWERIIWEPL